MTWRGPQQPNCGWYGISSGSVESPNSISKVCYNATLVSACCFPANQKQMCSDCLHALSPVLQLCARTVTLDISVSVQLQSRASLLCSACSAMMSLVAGCEILEEMRTSLNPSWALHISPARLVKPVCQWFDLLVSVYFQHLSSQKYDALIHS